MNTITVGIVTYKRPILLKSALKSVQKQNGKINEIIIVVNDQFKGWDDTFIQEITKNKKIKIISPKINVGLSNARNLIIESTKSDYIAFLDDDDAWTTTWIENVNNLLNLFKNPEVICGLVPPRLNRHKYRLFKLHYLFKEGYSPPVSTQVYQTKFLRKCEGYLQVKSGIDTSIWIAMLKYNPSVLITYGNWVKVGTDETERITTNKEARLFNLEMAFIVWKPYIIEVFGNEFFYLYKKKYLNFIETYFFISELKHLKHFSISKQNLKLLFMSFRIFFWNRIIGRNGNPTFKY